MPEDNVTRLTKQAAAARQRELEARIEAEAAEEAKARIIAAMNVAVGKLAAREGLQGGDTPDTVNTMQAPSAISNVRRSKAAIDDAHRRHAFVAALVKQGLTVAKAAEAIGRPRSTVQAWYKRPKDAAYREIPWECAEKIRLLYGVPHSAWHSVGPKV